ncbi:Histidine kinase [Pedobacter suwonensis]|uniref:Histidine kinase n=1 Tax=Pedobacter suwonensis TaxID=332999 RepID=A0A1I0TQV3_9SPHI|nr:histidine kinase [Pedobacter suwonensis]SFA54128.1 Histidine kinase [Pedobacter suwonensis]
MIKIIKKCIKKYWIHLLAWGVFIAYETVLIGLIYGVFGNLLTYCLHYAIVISYFYTVCFIGLPWATRFKNQTFYRIPLIFTVLFCIYLFFNLGADMLLIRYHIITHKVSVALNRDYVLSTLYRYIYFSGFASAYYFIRTYFFEKKRSNELEEQRLLAIINEERMADMLSKSHNDFLRAQINPHFLFNTLSYVYNNIKINPEDAGEAVIVLSDIMRFAIDSGVDDMVIIKDEMAQVEKLVYLYQLRKNQSIFIDLYFSAETMHLRMIPLVLLTLMENMFKHGNLCVEEKPALMAVFAEDNLLFIQTSNLVSYTIEKIGTNSGMKNIESRLRTAFGENLKFTYGLEGEDLFRVDIVIPLGR